MNLLQNLNEQQLAAVTLPNQSALILAGAGSGKTRVLTTRIAWLIQTGQMSPQSVLAVTFTNKAAKEMMTRLSAMLPINTRGMWIGTFHGLCNRMLRAHHRDAGLPSTFQILDSADQLGAIKRLLKAEQHRRRALSAAQPAAVHQQLEGGRAARAGRRGQRRLQPQVRRALRDLRRAVQPRGRVRLRRAAAALLRAARPQRDPAPALPGPLPPHPGRRVPGHQQAAVRVAEDAGRDGPQRDLRGGRRRPVDLRVPRRQRRQHVGLRARVPGAAT